MSLKKGIHVVVCGSMIIFATFPPTLIPHVNAEENVVSESSAKLAVLEIAEFELDQTFSADVTEYTATVSNEINTMSLLLDSKLEGSVITVNGEKVTNGDPLPYDLNTGENIFEITVINDSEVTTYKLTLVRQLNKNSSLSNLALSSGRISFSPEVTSYSVTIENSIDTITFKPQTAVNTSSVTVNGTIIDPKVGYSVELPVGKTVIAFVVTAENGTKTSYAVTITRVEKTETTSNIKEDSTNSTSSTTNKGQSSTSNLLTTEQPGSSRSTTLVQTFSTNNGGSQTGTQSETQTTANLSALSVSTGTWNKSFDSDTYTYHLAVGTDVTSVTIAAITEEDGADIEIEGGTNTTVSLPNQNKTSISVKVTNEDDQKTYVLVFDKDIEVASDSIESTETVTSGSTSEAKQTMSANQRGQNKPTTQMSNDSTENTESFWGWIKSLFNL